MRRLVILGIVLFGVLAAARLEAGTIIINGNHVAHATSRINISVEITEFREGGSPAITLLPGVKRYRISLVSRDPVALLDAELPVAAPASRFAVTIEDGRTFVRCVLEGLTPDDADARRRLVYSFRCEDVVP